MLLIKWQVTSTACRSPGFECQERAAVNWLTFSQTNLRRHWHKSNFAIHLRPGLWQADVRCMVLDL
jgi:hypothetical protein